MGKRREWASEEWQEFALKLVQQRHKSQNVQIVPDKVKGDAGLEFFTTDGCLYQCYAPEEVAIVAKAAKAMKSKGSRDLAKLKKNEGKIADILQSVKANRWILLCPFLDDKDVVAFVRAKGESIKASDLSFLQSDFEALVQSLDDFPLELESLQKISSGIPLSISSPGPAAILAASKDEMSIRMSEKLERAFPHVDVDQIADKRNLYIKAHLFRDNILDQMRSDHPILWEKSAQCFTAEEARLVAVGAGAGLPVEQLTESVKRIEDSLEADLPNLHHSTITQMALGTVSDWLMRCPLDFPKVDK